MVSADLHHTTHPLTDGLTDLPNIEDVALMLDLSLLTQSIFQSIQSFHLFESAHVTPRKSTKIASTKSFRF